MAPPPGRHRTRASPLCTSHCSRECSSSTCAITARQQTRHPTPQAPRGPHLSVHHQHALPAPRSGARVEAEGARGHNLDFRKLGVAARFHGHHHRHHARLARLAAPQGKQVDQAVGQFARGRGVQVPGRVRGVARPQQHKVALVHLSGPTQARVSARVHSIAWRARRQGARTTQPSGKSSSKAGSRVHSGLLRLARSSGGASRRVIHPHSAREGQ